MRHRLAVLTTIALLAGACAPAWAAFEDIEVSPRFRAIGGAGVAAAADVYAALGNPAALGWIEGVSGAASYVEPFSLGFAQQNAVAATLPLSRRMGGVGFAVRTFGVRYQGENLDNETTLSIAHGFPIMQDAQSALAVGWSVSLYSMSLGTSVTGIDPGKASTLGLGVGAVALVRDRTRVGFAIENLNNPSLGDKDHEDLARRLTGGVTYSPYAGVTTMLAMNSELGQGMEYRGGVELQATSFLWLRAGVASDPNVFTAGLGLAVKGLELDYGFSSGGGVLGETHHIGLEVHARAPWEGRP
ncbi:MAG TPA: hypothetical protein VFK69_06580 [Candidatus Eisenbacteria bacterium]|nr:hypothetical protein [Candidatus Eisenbacteria bacterium]